ncbi:uncharacterized protein LOC108865217 [Galendromus occidentalis]|uniref:Uncharacterized protein LOC108865217 n=1 Tax=Galendromus occidentalis TaxID=34638 RepID=A0AAJ7L7R4_9ACAR|nr:uncharacterized protein LOC108865217 [Galendromus occidentalis]
MPFSRECRITSRCAVLSSASQQGKTFKPVLRGKSDKNPCCPLKHQAKLSLQSEENSRMSISRVNVRKTPDFELEAPNPQRRTPLCASCGESLYDTSRIACSTCTDWTHARKACSGLSTAEARREIMIVNFKCARCTTLGELKETEPMEEGTTTQATLILILSELRDCKSKIVNLQEDNRLLRKENAEIRITLTQLRTKTAPPPTKHESRGRSRQRKQTESETHARAPQRPRSILRNSPTAQPPSNRKEPRTKTKTSNKHRPSEGLVVSEASYANEDAKKKLERALPVAKVKYCTRKLIVTLYNSAATAENVLNHLKSNQCTADRVIRIKTKTKTDSYRCFVIQCSDLDFEEIHNNEQLWHPASHHPTQTEDRPRPEERTQDPRTGPTTQVLSWNVEGLLGFMKKDSDFDFSPYSVVMLTETFLASEPDNQIVPNFKGYYSEAQRTKGRPSGGLAILVSPLIPDTKIVFKDEHILGVANATQQTTYLVAYFTPNNPVADIIADTHKDTRASDLIEALLLIDLHLLNDAQTMTYHAHNGQSAIDLMFVSENLTSRADLKVLPTIDRKHQRLSLRVTLSNPGTKLTGNRPGPPLRRIRECDLNKHIPAISQLPEHTLDETYQQFLTLIEKSTHVQPLKKRKNKPWFDSECRSLKQLSLSKIGTAEEKRPCLPKVDIPTFEEYYGNLYLSTEAAPTFGPARQHPGGPEDWYNDYITNDEVTETLRRMKRHKAVGPDRVAIDILKDHEILTPLVTRMFNSALNSGTIPSAWRTAHVKPIFKGKSSPEDPSNYRCISLASHTYKAFTNTLANRLTLHCLPKISDNQYGFLPHRSCDQAIQSLIEYIDSNEIPTYAVFIDFKAAFDNVNRTKLLQAVAEKFDIRGKILNTFRSILQPNKLIIDSGTDLSDPVTQYKGVAQGDSISPLFFVLFINSLLTRLERRQVLAKMYADDLVIASSNAEELQRALSSLSIWCEENEMIINTGKTKAMKFRKAGATGNTKLYINRTPIQLVQSFKYLGITMQPALGFSDHADQLLTRTATTIVCLGNLQKLPLTLALKIFQIKIMPTIRYGFNCISTKLARTNLEKLDKCKLLYLKSALGLSKYTSNTFVLTLTKEKTLCEDLEELGYKFDETVWKEYKENLDRKNAEFNIQVYSEGPAFRAEGWKLANRSSRAAICRITYHGYHHKFCTRKDFFVNCDNLCTCKYCGEAGINRLHILKCIYFENRTITEIVREITKTA